MTTPAPTTIITGVSRGIGHEMARHLATSGQRVITMGRHTMPELQALATEHGTDWSEILVDLADPQETEQAGLALSALLTAVEHVNLVLNAGTINPILPADQHTELSTISDAFHINIVAPIFLTGCFLKATQDAKDRRVMMISSGAGRNASQSWGVYCATKAAMDRYAEAVTLEAHPRLRISSVAPGIVDTPMQETIRSTPEKLFPQLKKFLNFHQDGALASAQSTARNLLTLLAREDFGSRPTDDVRQHTFES